MSRSSSPCVLVVTPEITYLPKGMGNIASFLTAKAGGMADVSAALISALFEQGADVHVAIPDYRSLFNDNFSSILDSELDTIRRRMPEEKVHLAEDRAFFYQNRVYSDYAWENVNIALAFQREVINHIIPKVMPSLIHCNDWMTGLIPAFAREMGIPSLFTIHNIHTVNTSLAHVEDKGVDAAKFWKHLYYNRPPFNYEETRDTNTVDFLASGVFAAHFVNTVSPAFLKEVAQGRHDFVPGSLRWELSNKVNAGCAVGILNAPDPSYNPVTDTALVCQYTEKNQAQGKRENKLFLQKALRLIQDPKAPLFFWPSRLDPHQKGCQLLADILYKVISRYWDEPLEIVFVANGEFQRHMENIVHFHNFHSRVAVCHFDEQMSRLAYGASDFILMPSLFEPCGLPQMIAPIYGSLPVAHDTGGIHDTVTHLDINSDSGNGFLFETYDSNGLFWAIEQAMHFHACPPEVKSRHIQRIMRESATTFNHTVTARQYIDLYEKMLKRPLINP